MLRELQRVPILSLCAATLSVAVAATTGCDSRGAETDTGGEDAAGTADEGGGGMDEGGDGADSADSGSSGDQGDSGSDGASDSGDNSGDGVDEGSGDGSDDSGEGDTADGGSADDGDSGDSSSTEVDIDAKLELSKKIGTVGILTFSVDGVAKDEIEEAWVEFGLEGDLNLRAPVQLAAEKYRTLLLGMKASRDYSARVKLVIDGETHRSSELEVTTGPAPNDLPVINVSSGPAGDKLSPGFIVTNTLRGADAVIIDNDGDYVWWYQTDMKISSRARMSYDGHRMWFRDANVMIGDGIIRRIDMDGENEEVMDLPLSHHDLVVLPDDTLAYLVRGENNCDDLVELDPETGDTRTVFKIGQYFDPANADAGCHTNSLQYHAEDDSYTASLLYNNLYLKFTREGQLEWTFGSSDSDFSGVSTWYHQHGHQMWGNHFLMFNNAEAGQNSMAREFEFDFDAMTAKEVWSYDGGLHTAQLGDVQRLDNGNTLVTYSIRGVIHEVDREGELVQEFAFALGDGLGYVIKRETLYGPAPK